MSVKIVPWTAKPDNSIKSHSNTGLITIAKKPTRASRVPTSKFWGMPNTVLLIPAHPSHALATHTLPWSGFSFSFSLIRICDRYHSLSSAGLRQCPDVAETYNFGLGVEYLPANPALGPDVSWRERLLPGLRREQGAVHPTRASISEAQDNFTLARRRGKTPKVWRQAYC